MKINHAQTQAFKNDILAILKKHPCTFQELLREVREYNAYLSPRFLDTILRSLISEEKIYYRYKFKTYNLKTSENIIGIFRATRKGFAFVENNDITVFIPAKFVLNALDGDTVKVRLFSNDLSKQKETSTEQKRAGTIVRILQRNGNNIVGTVKKNDTGEIEFYPEDFLFKYPIVLNSKLPVKEDETLVTKFYDFTNNTIYLEVKENLGKRENPKIDYLLVVKKNNLKLTFPKEVILEAEKLPTKISDNDLINRKDKTSELVVTIDGKDSKDLDDAISVKSLPNEQFLLTVYIADVSHYVKQDSELDHEAYKRGVSIYLINKVLPMLPEQLSNNLCSLNPNEKKLTLACEMVIDKTGKILSKQVYQALIISKYRLTYSEVDIFYENNPSKLRDSNELGKMLKDALLLSKILRKQKLSAGMIDFNLAETKVILDKNDDVKDIILKDQTIAEKMIEDLMVITNEAVAKLFTEKKLPNIFRVHSKPKLEKLVELTEFLKVFGYQLTEKNLENLQSIDLAQFIETLPNTSLANLIKKKSIQTMEKAVYSAFDSGHYALAVKNYLHFTSPIRRYPDLIVHRLLKKWILSTSEPTPDIIQQVHNYLITAGKELSERERIAMLTERKLVDIKKARYAKALIGKQFNGSIIAILSVGIFVEIIKGIQGLILIDSENETYFYDETQKTFINKFTKTKFTLGQEILVQVESVNLIRGMIDLKLVTGIKKKDES